MHKIFQYFYKTEQVLVWSTLICLVYIGFTDRPIQISCDDCYAINHQIGIKYLITTIMVLVSAGILVLRLYHPLKVLRLLAWVIVVITLIATTLSLFFDDVVVIREFPSIFF
jgi:hypothetical protein